MRQASLDKQNLTVKAVHGRLTCGDCVGLNRERLISGAKICSQEGMKHTRAACPKFKPDVFVLSETLDNEDGGRSLFAELARLTGGLSERELRVVGAALMNEATTRRNGFSFYQKVFVRYRGTARSDYLSNFMACRILSADENTVRVCSDDGKTIFTYENTGSMGPSIYTRAAFDPLRIKMMNKGLVTDPEHERNTTRALRAAELAEFGEIKLHTDGLKGVTTPEKVSRSNKGAGRKGRKSTILDLTVIAQEIERGAAGVKQRDGTVVLDSNRYKKRSGKGREVELSDM